MLSGLEGPPHPLEGLQTLGLVGHFPQSIDPVFPGVPKNDRGEAGWNFSVSGIPQMPKMVSFLLILLKFG